MRFKSLDAFRGLAAVAIISSHIRIYLSPQFFPLDEDVYLLVDFFFVLSGFVIAHAYSTRLTTWDELCDFVVRRVGRIWPLHGATLAVMLVAFVAISGLEALGATDLRPDLEFAVLGDLFQHVFLLNSFGLTGGLSWNIPSWSIGAELISYLLFAGLMLFRAPVVLAFAGIAVVSLLGIELFSEENLEVTHDLGALRAMYGFFSGALACYFYGQVLTKRRMTVALATLLETLVFGTAIVFLLVANVSLLSYAAPFVFSAVVIVFAHESGIVSRILRTPPFLFFGRISFSIYLTHFVLLYLGILLLEALDNFWPAIKHLNFPLRDDLLTLAFTLIVILVSTWTYSRIERPGQQFFAGLRGRRPPERLSSDH